MRTIENVTSNWRLRRQDFLLRWRRSSWVDLLALLRLVDTATTVPDWQFIGVQRTSLTRADVSAPEKMVSLALERFRRKKC